MKLGKNANPQINRDTGYQDIGENYIGTFLPSDFKLEGGVFHRRDETLAPSSIFRPATDDSLSFCPRNNPTSKKLGTRTIRIISAWEEKTNFLPGQVKNRKGGDVSREVGQRSSDKFDLSRDYEEREESGVVVDNGESVNWMEEKKKGERNDRSFFFLSLQS